jgi:2-dehydropantoate 2-reductase
MLRAVHRNVRSSSCRMETMARRLSHGAAEAAVAPGAPKNEHEAIHVLGVGNLGKYVAHAVASASPKASNLITLLFHREGLEEQWRAAGSGIRCIMTNGVADTRSGFHLESLLPSTTPSTSGSTAPTPAMPIKYLIVATKTYNTTGALSLVRDRLDSESSVLFLQNGMGMFGLY